MLSSNQLANRLEYLFGEYRTDHLTEEELKEKFNAMGETSLTKHLKFLGKRNLSSFLEEYPEKFYKSGSEWKLKRKRHESRKAAALYVCPGKRILESRSNAGSSSMKAAEKQLVLEGISEDELEGDSSATQKLWGFFVKFEGDTGVFYDISSRRTVTIKKKEDHEMLTFYTGTMNQLSPCENDGRKFNLNKKYGRQVLSVPVVKPDLTCLNDSQRAEFVQGVYAEKFGHVNDSNHKMVRKQGNKWFLADLEFKEDAGKFFDIVAVFAESPQKSFFPGASKISEVLDGREDGELKISDHVRDVVSQKRESAGIAIATNVDMYGHTYCFVHSPLGVVRHQQMRYGKQTGVPAEIGKFYWFTCYKSKSNWRRSEPRMHSQTATDLREVPTGYAVNIQEDNCIEIPIATDINSFDLEKMSFFMTQIGRVRTQLPEFKRIREWCRAHDRDVCPIEGKIKCKFDVAQKKNDGFVLVEMEIVSSRKRAFDEGYTLDNKKSKVNDASDDKEDETKEKDEEEEYGDLWRDYYSQHC